MYSLVMKVYADITTSNSEEHALLVQLVKKLRATVVREDILDKNNVVNYYANLKVSCSFQQWLDIKSSELYSRASFQVKK